MTITRRSFLQATTVAAATAGGLHAATAAPRRRHPIVDCHTHFYNPARKTGPGSFRRSALPKDYRRVAVEPGVTGTVVVEASPFVEDNQWLLDMADKDSFLLGLVGHLEPGSNDFPKLLKRFDRHEKFLGIRVNLQQAAKRLDEAAFLSHLELLGRRALVLDLLCNTSTLPKVAPLAKKLPRVRMMVNHLANPRIDGKQPEGKWADGIRAAAAHKNVSCKVSALADAAWSTTGSAAEDIDFYRPWLDHVWKAFGDDRLIYSSNWPVCLKAAEYAQVQQLAEQYVQDKEPAVIEKFFHGNAARFYRWPQAKSQSAPQ